MRAAELDTAALLYTRGHSLRKEWTANSIRLAIEAFREANNRSRENGDERRASECAREIAKLQLILGESDLAYTTLVTNLREHSSRRFPAEAAHTTALMSVILSRRGDAKRADIFANESTLRAEQSGDNSAKASADFAAGELLASRNDFRTAAAKYAGSVAACQAAADENCEADGLLAMSFMEMSLGEPLDGLTHAEIAYRKYGQLNDRRGMALALIARGHLLSVMARKQDGIAAYLEALSYFPDDLDLFDRGSLYNGLGYNYEELGDWTSSLRYRRKAYELFQQDRRVYGEIATLPSLIKLSFAIGDGPKAREYFARTETLAHRLKDEYWLGIAMKQMGEFYFNSGQSQESLGYFVRSLTVVHRAGLKAEVALIQNRIGQLLESGQKLQEARRVYNAALAESRAISHRIAEAEAMHGLASVSEKEGKTNDALEWSYASLALSEDTFSDLGNSDLRRSSFSSIYDRYQLATKLLVRRSQLSVNGEDIIEALRISERLRARSLLEALRSSGAELLGDAHPEDIRRAAETRTVLNAKTDRLTDLLTRGSRGTEIDRLEDEIHELQLNLERMKSEVSQKSPVYSAIKNPPPFDLEDFQRNVLDDRSVLLEFSLGNDESYLWVVGKEDFAAYVLPGRERIEGEVENLRALLAARQMKTGESIDEHQRRTAEAEAKYWPAAREFSEMILGQAAEKIRGKRLIAVPDGKLHYFPFSALPLPDATADEPMVLTNEIVYEPSAQTLSLLTKLAKKTTATKDMLIFSDPVFTAEDTRMSGVEVAAAPADLTRSDNFRFVESLGSLPRLPGSGAEAESIANIVGGSAVDSFSGFDATRERLLNTNVTDYKILHFATHGVVKSERPELSGIVMSRYGAAGEQLNEFIRLQDIYGMRLNADLVVLSACETGIGKEVKGEGMMSLNNAFLQSGAKSVLASLWKVEDGASQILMKEFYSGISNGLTPSEALRGAQVKLARDPRYSSPFYWAAFTLQGDLNIRPAIGSGIPVWVYAAASLLILMFGFYLLRSRRRASHLGPTRP